MEKTEHKGTKSVKGRATPTRKHEDEDSAGGAGGSEEVVALKKRIARLESENRQLRNQVAVSTDSMHRASQALSDSVREQQHTFLKYSNVRRY